MDEFNVRWALMVMCLLVFGLSFGALLIAAWRHHRRDRGEQGNFHSSLLVEISWTIVPCVIVLILVWPTARIFWLP